MNWIFHPKNKEITTSLPMSVEVWDYTGTPSVTLSGVGKLELKPTTQGKLKTDFYVTLPGEYKLQIKDSVSQVDFPILVAQHQYLDFKNEFGVFFILFLFVMGGIIIWTSKIMKKKTS
jgi:hypothetical protein